MRLRAALMLVAVALLAGLVAAGAAEGAVVGGGPGGPTFGYGGYVAETRALTVCTTFKTDSAQMSCYIPRLLQLIVASHDPAAELPRIDGYAARLQGVLYANCHILMHAVGREYGQLEKVTLARLQDYLPKTNNPNCSAGFAHGLITALGPQVQKLGPKGAVAICDRSSTRYQRYSCIHGLGHAYMRIYVEALMPALQSCRLLGSENAADCAQGAFHDYWFSIEGADGTRAPSSSVTSPRALCGAQAKDFVRACWYRAFLEHPPKRGVTTAAGILATCKGLTGLQHSGCVTAASLIVTSDPFAQMKICASLRGDDAASCVRGVRAPAVAGNPLRFQLPLIERCSTFDRSSRAACYTWLGKALNVVTNGAFLGRGCDGLSSKAARAECRAGARAYEGPLETFS